MKAFFTKQPVSSLLYFVLYFSLGLYQVSSGQAPSPYSGTPFELPGRIEFENYDDGGEGIGYHDLSPGNYGNTYRPDDVDIEPTSGDATYNIGWTDAGEWLVYTVHVTDAGLYDFNLRYSTPLQDQTFHVEIDNIDVTGAVVLPLTGGWQNWQTLPVRNISLTAGNHVLKFFMETGGVNINYLEVFPSGLHTPYGGTATALPGRLEIENYDEGVQSVAYNDLTEGNTGGAYRTGDVDIETADDGSGSIDVGWTQPDEWLVYTVDVTAAGNYDFKLRIATPMDGKSVHIEINDIDVTGSFVVPNTGGFQDWQTYTLGNIPLAQGSQVLKVFMETGSINLNYLDVVPRGIESPYSGIPMALPGRLEIENYDLGGDGIAFHDASQGNAGHSYRSDDVDIEPTNDAGGGYDIGWTDAGEWLAYLVHAPASVVYHVNLRCSTPLPDQTIHIEIDGIDVTGSITIPVTGGWENWQSLPLPDLSLIAGDHIVKVFFETGGVNINYLDFTTDPTFSVYTVTNTADSGPGSLRAALDSANVNPDFTKVLFNISGAGPFVINSSADLYVITPVLIDGSSQPGYSAITKNPVVQVRNNDNNYSWTNITLTGNSKGSEIRGLYLTNSTKMGIWVLTDSITIRDNVINYLREVNTTNSGVTCIGFENSGSDSKVFGNVFGTDSSGADLILNHEDSLSVGVYIYSTNGASIHDIQIGGTGTGEANQFAFVNDGIILYGNQHVNHIRISVNTFISMAEAPVILFPGTNVSSGSQSKAAPVISGNSGTVLSGTAEDGDLVQVYLSNQGGKDAVQYLGSTVATGSAWSFDLSAAPGGVPADGSLLVAAATDLSGTSSGFSAAFTMASQAARFRAGVSAQSGLVTAINDGITPNILVNCSGHEANIVFENMPSGQAAIYVSNALGQPLMAMEQADIASGSYPVSFGKEAQGVYIIQVVTAQGTFTQKVFIK